MFLALTALIPATMIIGQGLADVMLITIALAFLLRSGLTGNWRWTREKWFLLALVLWFWMIFISFFALADFTDSIKRALLWLRFIIFTAALKEWVLDKASARRTTVLFISATVAFTLIYVGLQFFLGDSLYGFDNTQSGRLTGPFDKWVAGTYLAKTAMPVLGMAATLSMALTGKASRQVCTVCLASLILLVGIMITGERSAFFSFALAVAVFFIAINRLRRWLFVPVLFGIVLLGLVFVTSPAVKTRMLDTTISQVKNFSQSHYGMIFSNAALMIKTYPLTGVGLKNYRRVCQQAPYHKFVADDPSSCGLHPHNPYLEWAVETGLPGVCLFIGLMALMLFQIIRTLRHAKTEDYPLGLGALLSLVIFLWPAMSTMSLFTNWNAILFWYALALAFSFTQSNPTTVV